VVEIAAKHLGGEPDVIAASHASVDPRLVSPQTGADIYWSVEMTAMIARGEVGKNFQQKDLFDFALAR
jgi:hypothetical protein